ncbi:MAG: hypothetical protein M9928_14520 [Anaerolineae bacterium]|nr:hypothetical protein [Anaerolineae bacterium]
MKAERLDIQSVHERIEQLVEEAIQIAKSVTLSTPMQTCEGVVAVHNGSHFSGWGHDDETAGLDWTDPDPI